MKRRWIEKAAKIANASEEEIILKIKFLKTKTLKIELREKKGDGINMKQKLRQWTQNKKLQNTTNRVSVKEIEKNEGEIIAKDILEEYFP